MIFSSFFSVGQIPNAWSKGGIITPIYKSENQSDPANYRSVSLTCVALFLRARLWKKIIAAQTLDYLHDNKFDYHRRRLKGRGRYGQWSNCKIRARGTLSSPFPLPSPFPFPYPSFPSLSPSFPSPPSLWKEAP